MLLQISLGTQNIKRYQLWLYLLFKKKKSYYYY